MDPAVIQTYGVRTHAPMYYLLLNNFQILASFGTTLSPSKTEAYGADTTFTFAAGTLDAGNLSKPAVSE